MNSSLSTHVLAPAHAPRRPLELGGGEGFAPPPFHWLPEALGLLRRRARLLANGALAGLALAIFYLLVASPKFVASTSLLIDPQQADPFHQQAREDSQGENAYVESQVQVLQQDSIALRVAQALNLRDNKVFNRVGFIGSVTGAVTGLGDLFGGGKPSQAQRDRIAAHKLAQALDVRRVGLSYVIEIAARTGDAKLSADIANGVTRAYIDDQLQAKAQVTHDAGRWLQDRLGELRRQTAEADDAVQRLKARENIVDTEKGPLEQHELADLGTNLVAARTTLASAAAKLNQARQLRLQAYRGNVPADAMQSLIIGKLQQDYLETNTRLAEISARYGARHEVARNLRRHMADVRQSIAAELDRLVGSYQAEYDVALQNERGLETRLRDLAQVSARLNAERRTASTLESQADTYRTLYSQFLQRYSQAAQDQSFPISSARVVATALPPLKRSWPKAPIVLLAGLVGGGALGAAGAFLREALSRTIKTPQQVWMATGHDCIASLPFLPKAIGPSSVPSKGGEGGLVASSGLRFRAPMLAAARRAPASPYAEGVRRIWTRIQRARRAGQPVQVIGCVSAAVGEGKTTLAANLAGMMAEMGVRTLLIDGDLRRRSLSAELWRAPHLGLLEAIEDPGLLSQAIVTDAETGLDFLPVAARAGGWRPADLSKLDQLDEVLKAARGRYDAVLLDLPALDRADAQAVAHLTDAFLMVVGWDQVSPDAVSHTLRDAGIDGSRLLGVVLNKVAAGG